MNPTNGPTPQVKETVMTDNVNHPAHYEANGPFECIELTEQYDFCLGNTIKYVWRHMDKGKPFEDLSKALWYIQREIDTTDSDYSPAPMGAARKLFTLSDMDFAHMADFWYALFAGSLIDAKQEIQTRAKKLAKDSKPRAIPTTRAVRAWKQGERLRTLRNHDMTWAKTTQAMRARGFSWSDNTLNNIEAGNRRIQLDEALALLETYGYTDNNMFTALDYILERTA